MALPTTSRDGFHGPNQKELPMKTAKVIRYRVKPDCADENERLIRDVFAELDDGQPDGLQYVSFRLADGVSFVHVAVIEGDVNPLQSSKAFAEFQADIQHRVEEGPIAADAAVVGSYRLGNE
jgi:hypothetical protein